MATRKLKITYVARMCGSHISFGQHRFRFSEVLAQPMGLRKGFPQEGTPKPNWVKGKVMGRKVCQGKRAAGPLALAPEGGQARVGCAAAPGAESWASSGREVTKAKFSRSA